MRRNAIFGKQRKNLLYLKEEGKNEIEEGKTEQKTA